MHLSQRDIQELVESRQTPEKIRKHLEVCSQCRAIAEEYRFLQNQLRHVEPYQIPETFVYNVTRDLPDLERKTFPVLECFLVAMMTSLIIGIFSFIRFDFQRMISLFSHSPFRFLFSGDVLPHKMNHIGLVCVFLLLFWIFDKILLSRKASL